jgi:murein peptide amidase A
LGTRATGRGRGAGAGRWRVVEVLELRDLVAVVAATLTALVGVVDVVDACPLCPHAARQAIDANSRLRRSIRCRRTLRRGRAVGVGSPVVAVRRSTLLLIVLPALLWCLGSTSAAAARRLVIGTSVQGRPIGAWTLGSTHARRKILLIGCIHGNECAGLAITSALRRARVPTGVQLWIVPEMNPDGTAAGTRQNAHGVDLNRNFPYRWQRISELVYFSGPHATSEPETRAAMRLVTRIRPAVTITYHQHMDLVDMAGGDRGVARRYAQLAGLRATCLTFLAGVETGWSNSSFPGTTSFVVELPAGAVGPRALARHLRAIRGAELGQRSGSATRCESVTQAS